MDKVVLELKDGSKKEVEKGIKFIDFIKEISNSLAREAVGVKLNDEHYDLDQTIEKDGKFEILKFDDEDGKLPFRHTSAHILAQAVKRLFPEAKLAIGPAIENGFYYDIDLDYKITEEDLSKIKKEMKAIVKENLKIEKFILPKEEAIKYVKENNEDYKIELIEELPDGEEISFYKQGEFTDLCAGPHLPSTKMVKSIELLSVAGAYWRGSEKNKMLQRIYGTSFPKKKLLDEYLERLEEAKKRDHRKLGKELDLFSLNEAGPGFPFYHPKGMIIRNELVNFWKQQHRKYKYDEINTPIILNEDLWHKSGHWDHYQDNMYFTKIDDNDFAVKPMNCPGAILMYKRKINSYRDLPIRIGELGLVHRHELSGALHGLMRVRCFTQDDAHIFMLEEQITDELVKVIDMINYFYEIFGFKYHVELSTKPEKAMGTDEEWDFAIKSLKEALDKRNLEYKINEGDGAFYGPKIDFHLEDCLGRTWQCGTIQLDFQMPQRFDLNYIGKDGEKHRPIMIHRVIYGSLERFLGVLIEHYAGKFPLWISPVQVKVIPVSDKHLDFSEKLVKTFEDHDIRVEIDSRSEKVGFKIREAQLEKAPYMLVIGDNEVNSDTLSVRSRDSDKLIEVELDKFIDMIKEEIRDRKVNN